MPSSLLVPEVPIGGRELMRLKASANVPIEFLGGNQEMGLMR